MVERLGLGCLRESELARSSVKRDPRPRGSPGQAQEGEVMHQVNYWFLIFYGVVGIIAAWMFLAERSKKEK